MDNFFYLNVAIPPNCEVGSQISVCYEDNYYEIVVPPGGPGETIQVAIPLAVVDPTKSESAIKVDDSAVLATSPEQPKKLSTDTKMALAGVGAGVIVGSLILGPLVIGAVVLGGAAGYAASHHAQNKERTINEDGTVAVAVAEPKEGEDGTLLSKVHCAGVKVASSIQSVDQKYQISSKTNEAVHATIAKAKETDEKYQISAKASAAASATVSKAKQINEEHKITERANAAASSMFTSLSAGFSKLSASSNTGTGTSSTSSSASTTTPTATATAVPTTRP